VRLSRGEDFAREFVNNGAFPQVTKTLEESTLCNAQAHFLVESD
jgi:hypothetical protein